MEEHKEELATIESIDSGAVYTLALKTHVGMSIDTWRYFAGLTIHHLQFPDFLYLAIFARLVRQNSWVYDSGEQCST